MIVHVKIKLNSRYKSFPESSFSVVGSGFGAKNEESVKAGCAQ